MSSISELTILVHERIIPKELYKKVIDREISIGCTIVENEIAKCSIFKQLDYDIYTADMGYTENGDNIMKFYIDLREKEEK